MVNSFSFLEGAPKSGNEAPKSNNLIQKLNFLGLDP